MEHPDDEQEEHGSKGGFSEADDANRGDADTCRDDEPWEGSSACVPFTDTAGSEFLGHAAGELVEDFPGVAFHALDRTGPPVAVQMPSGPDAFGRAAAGPKRRPGGEC